MKPTTFTLYTFISFLVIFGFAAIDHYQEAYYGMAATCILLSITFLVILLRKLRQGEGDWTGKLELTALSLIALSFFFKSYLLLWHGMHWFHLTALVLLFIATLFKFINWIREKDRVQSDVYWVNTILVVAFIVLLVSDTIHAATRVIPFWLVIPGILLSAICLLYISFLRGKSFLVSGKKRDILDVRRWHGYWLLLGYTALYGYFAAVNFGWTDPVEFRRLPPRYVELFNEAEYGKETPVNGIYRYEIYLEGYRDLMEKRDE